MNQVIDRIAVMLALFLLFSGGCGRDTQSQDKVQEIQVVDRHHRNSDKPAETGGSKKPGSKPIPSETGPWPEFVCKQTTHTFGRIPAGSSGKHIFTITNAGDADLELAESKTTSNIVRFVLSSRVVEPGKTAELQIEWISRAPNGNFLHGGYIYTNDPKKPKVTFSVTGIFAGSDGK